jgi:hypothetical protein
VVVFAPLLPSEAGVAEAVVPIALAEEAVFTAAVEVAPTVAVIASQTYQSEVPEYTGLRVWDRGAKRGTFQVTERYAPGVAPSDRYR